MALPSSPPQSMVPSVELGDSGWPVFAVQSALNSIKADYGTGWEKLTLDGDFGPMSDRTVRAFQTKYNLTVDGQFGPASSRKAISLLDAYVHKILPELPAGLMRGFAEGEGANNLAAVNWSVPGGVDCGVMQFRVYETNGSYDFTKLIDAFSPQASMIQAASTFLGRADAFYSAAGVVARPDREEFSKRLAVLAHNWPAGAYDISKDGNLSNPNGTASWVPSGIKFPDGEPVNTRWEWCQFYALGRGSWPGSITKYVTDWL